MSEEDKSAVAKTIGEQGTKSEYQYRTAESFLNSIKQNNQTNDVDLSKYQVGQRVYHKKFGEGTITKLEQEGNDEMCIRDSKCIYQQLFQHKKKCA